LLNNVASIVMCNEIISYVKRIIRGFDLTREKIGVDVLRRVGPGGHFLTVSHTRDHFQEEIWRPKHLNRDSPAPWAKRGGPRYEEVVTQKARDILKTHQPRPLPEPVRQRLAEIAAEAEDALAEIQFVS
jgi:trimethylamine--corrinoid protein Co-methyltransferase